MLPLKMLGIGDCVRLHAIFLAKSNRTGPRLAQLRKLKGVILWIKLIPRQRTAWAYVQWNVDECDHPQRTAFTSPMINLCCLQVVPRELMIGEPVEVKDV